MGIKVYLLESGSLVLDQVFMTVIQADGSFKAVDKLAM